MRHYSRKKVKPPQPEPIKFPRSDPAELALFDPGTKTCTMNCGSHTDDPRSKAEQKFQCEDCLTHPPKTAK